jgi:hypothetical protein
MDLPQLPHCKRLVGHPETGGSKGVVSFTFDNPEKLAKTSSIHELIRTGYPARRLPRSGKVAKRYDFAQNLGCGA